VSKTATLFDVGETEKQATAREYVYVRYSKDEIGAHPILKKTAKRVTISPGYWLPEDIGTERENEWHRRQRLGGKARIHLDREALTRNRKIWHDAFSWFFYLECVTWEQAERDRAEAIKARKERQEREREAFNAWYARHDDGFGQTIIGMLGQSAHKKNLAVCLLGLNLPYSESDLKAAYRRRARETHPDHGGDEEDFRKIQEAYDLLLKSL
jgi:hypothetical protein